MISEKNRYLTEEYINDLMRDGKAAGAAVCIINDRGETLYENYFGYRDKANRLPVNGDTIFGLASITKSFVALSILQLAEKGIVDLDAPLQTYIPEYTGKNRRDKVTLRHLLTHSAGYYLLPRICVDQVASDMGISEQQVGDFSYYVPLQQEAARQVAEQMDRQCAENGDISGRPGEFFSYCNDGYGIISDVVRRFGDCDTFAGYIKKHVLLPLGMSRSCCDFISPAEDSNSSLLYQYTDGKEICHHDYHDRAFCLNGAGSMKSTLNDLKKYFAMFLNYGKGLNGDRILSEAGIRDMTSPKIEYGQHDSYGYGCIQKHFDRIRTIEHSGGLPGVSSYFKFSYDNGLAVIVLCNTTDGGAGLIADALMRMAMNENPRPLRNDYPEFEWDKDFLETAAGEYAPVGRSGERIGTSVMIKNENGRPELYINGEKKLFVPCGRHEGILVSKNTERFIRIRTKLGVPFAVQYGSEMYRKL